MIVTLPGHGLSKAEFARDKPWIKRLTGIDPAHSDVRAFRGPFHRFTEVVEVPEGAFFLTFKPGPLTSGTPRTATVTLYQATSVELTEQTTVDGQAEPVTHTGQLTAVSSWNVDVDACWAPIRDQVSTLMAAAAVTSRDAIVWTIDPKGAQHTIPAPPPGIFLLLDEGALVHKPVVDGESGARLTGRDLDIAELAGYQERWARTDAALAEHDAAPHHGDVCNGAPNFSQDSVGQWSVYCGQGSHCEFELAGHGSWEVTGCESRREAGARFFGGDDPALYC